MAYTAPAFPYGAADLDAEVRASRAQVVSEVFGRKVTRGQLSEAFDRVSDPLNWKNPIDRVVSIADARERAMIEEAVVFFTGSRPTFTKVNRPASGGPDNYRVKAAGYYATCGA